MRVTSAFLLAALVGCGSSDSGPLDASIDSSVDAAEDASSDASVDAGTDAATDAGADAGCQPTVLLVGGTDVATQGWTTTSMAPATVSYGADYVELATTTSSGASIGGQLLLSYPNAVTAGMPFAIEVVMQVVSVNVHNPLDSGAALMGSFTAPFGTGAQRGSMVYLDPAALGWADDSQTQAFAVTDGAYHTYVFAVDGSGVATVRVDGNPAPPRNGFTTNGTFAIGDQTNDPNVDSTLRIRSVTKLCP